MRRRLYLCQINNTFGTNAFLPYSTAMLWSHARSHGDIADSYECAGWLMLREPLDMAMSRISDPHVIGLSCYLWNWNYNMELAKRIKAAWPSCRIICGGPQVPDDSRGFLETHPYIDFLVHGEGEMTMVDLLRCIRDDGDPGKVLGISHRLPDGSTNKTDTRARLSDLATLPSPYLDGIMDDIINAYPQMDWHASHETHRGCPYSCTFCDWGSAVYTKVRQFPDDRLLAEMEWFGQRQIDLLYNVDANYGMFPRDIALTKALVDVKRRHGGYPRKFRASYAKKSDDKVFEIAKMLNDAGMSKGVTLSTQSMDGTVLQVIKRRNIAMDAFKPLAARYRAEAIPTYTEIILGLPAETLQSYMDGIEQLLEGGQHDNLNIYLCMLLLNSEMNQPEYRERYGIISRILPMADNHSTAADMDGITEYHEIVIGTKAMPHEQWKQAWLIGWMIQALHCLDLTQAFARDYRRRHGSHMAFYQRLLHDHAQADTVLGQQIRKAQSDLDHVLAGGAWRGHDEHWGMINWPMEELTFLQIREDPSRFYAELRGFLLEWMSEDRADQLIEYQRHCTLGPYDSDHSVLHSEWDWTDPLASRRMTSYRFTSPRYYNGDRWSWARDLVWYGRKQSALKRNREIYHDMAI